MKVLVVGGGGIEHAHAELLGDVGVVAERAELGYYTNDDSSMALVVDVHTDPNTGRVLEEAVGTDLGRARSRVVRVEVEVADVVEYPAESLGE